VHLLSIRNEKPTDVTVSILFIYRRISTCFEPTERYGYWTNGCGNSCVNSPEDGPVGPKHVEIRRYMNKIETVTSVGFSFLMCNVMLPSNFENYIIKRLRMQFLHALEGKVKVFSAKVMKTQRLDRILGLRRYLTFGTTRTAEFSALRSGRPLSSRKFLGTCCMLSFG